MDDVKIGSSQPVEPMTQSPPQSPAEDGHAKAARRYPLARLILKRVLYTILMLWIVSVLVFIATQGLPGDTARAILGQNATDQQVNAIRESLGLNRSIPTQYFSWIGGMFKGDLGNSLANHVSVASYLGPRIVNSLALMFVACLLAIPLALFLGIYCAVRRGRLLDRLVSSLALVLSAIPPFVIALALILLFCINVFHWLPPVSLITTSKSIWSQFSMVILPAATLAFGVFPYVTYMIRSSMIEALDSQHVEVARLSGVPERVVIMKHAFLNVLAPTAQVVALQFAYLVGGAVAVETVFSFPGIGLSLFGAIQFRDLPVVQFLTVFIAGLTLVATLVADVVGILVTPRIRTALR